MQTIERPEFVTDAHLEYLDDLRESGVINMFGAADYVARQFPMLTRTQARQVLSYWMQTFGEAR